MEWFLLFLGISAVAHCIYEDMGFFTQEGQ
jgi:hypothetical protein